MFRCQSGPYIITLAATNEAKAQAAASEWAQTTYGQQIPADRWVVQPTHHGTTGSYTNNGCRCDLCREAWRLYKADYRRRNYATRAPNTGRLREE